MKLYELRQIAEYLSRFDFIKRMRRIDDNIIECDFKEEKIYFNLQKQHSFIFKNDRMQSGKYYKAPFDTMLQKYFTKVKVESIHAMKNDRVLKINVNASTSYKTGRYSLVLEFTGRNTNAIIVDEHNTIIVDEHNTIIEALRHVDEFSSSRVIRPGLKLAPIPPRKIEENPETIDVERFLYDVYDHYEQKRIQSLKKSKIKTVDKKIGRLQQKYEGLEHRQDLEAQANRFETNANVILAHLHEINSYDTKLATKDFEGNDIVIEFPKDTKPNRLSDYYYNKARRLRQKLQNLHIEKQSLEDKIAFYKRLKQTILEAKSSNEIEMILPKRGRSKARRERSEFETFWIEDFKILVGRSSNENQKLLQSAKANDIWMHLKDIPSAHCIIKTDKQQVPDNVIAQAAKLCVDFSVTYAGDYLVDYTKRKNVTVKEGSNVLYVKYDTISIRKEASAAD